jgi:hypothetical protein
MLVSLRQWARDHNMRFMLFDPSKCVRDGLKRVRAISDFCVPTLEDMMALLTYAGSQYLPREPRHPPFPLGGYHEVFAPVNFRVDRRLPAIEPARLQHDERVGRKQLVECCHAPNRAPGKEPAAALRSSTTWYASGQLPKVLHKHDVST